MSPAGEILAVLSVFQTAFSQPTWNKTQVLILGTILSRGRRTVTAALRQMGLSQERQYSKYHQALNRARWSGKELSKLLLQLVVKTFVLGGGTVTIVIDEHLERRRGRKIRKIGHYRDSKISSKRMSVSNQGLRRIVMTVVVSVPWTKRSWALPFMSVLATTPKVSVKLGIRHKTIGRRARQMIILVRRWLPQTPIVMIGDGAYSSLELGLRCRKMQATLIAPLRLTSCLYDEPPARERKRGRPRKVGEKLPKLKDVLDDRETAWQSIDVDWYGGKRKRLLFTSGKALWYRDDIGLLPIGWVLTRDPDEELDPKAYFSTDPNQSAHSIISQFVKRWTIEVTFEESRAHLGIETQRQWSDKAIERTTPCLFGLYSLIALFANALYPDGRIPFRTAVWYKKDQATFADVLAVVRSHLWGNFIYPHSASAPDLLLIPKDDLDRLSQAVCYSH
jgi:hypothetical protein